MRRGRRVAVMAAIFSVVGLGSTGFDQPPATLAMLIDSATRNATFTTDTLSPATGLSGSTGTSVTLSWTSTVDGYASGYQVLRATASGGPYSQIGTVTPRTVTTTTDAPAPGPYWYELVTYAGSWTSAATGPVSAHVTTSTARMACASNAADSGGDGDGYETGAGSGCADDGLPASDINSGTNASTICGNAGKDRHRFATFGLGLPATVTAIEGISVTVKVGLSSTAGTNRICAELSWNAGTSWTPAQQVTLTSTSLTAYTLGGSAFLWGQAWAVGDFSDANFRVRLTDVANSTSRTFTLDSVQVQVTYTP